MNPVKAKMVAREEGYEWSSYRAKISEDDSSWLDFDEIYLGVDSPAKAYREFVEIGISTEEQCFIR